MKDPDDCNTEDWVPDFDELGIPPEIDFNEDMGTPEEDIMVCPSCHENEVSGEQIAEQSEGEQCTICNFHTWEVL